MITNNKVHTAVDVTDNYNDIKAYGPSLEYIKYNQEYMELMNEIAQRKSGVYGIDEFDPASFDEAWTVTGKTNDDEDRATVKNLTGNGNDLVLSNFAFAEESGYGLYQQNFNKERWVIATSSRIEATKTNSSFNITKVKSTSIQLYYLSKQEEVAFTVTSTKVRVVGLTDGQSVNYRYFIDGVANDFLISSDGIYDLPKFEFPAKGNYYGFNFTKIQDSCNITIEQIPDYEGYLVTDGVDDSARALNINLGENFTLIGEWRLFSNTPIINAGVSLHPQLHIFNKFSNGISVSFRNVSTRLYVKTLKAICSDGRCYDDDWNDLNINVGDMISSNINTLFLGYNDTNFTKIAFKNLAIYNGKVLTKDQCIKAYNYLQTLK